jgi:hypothetical protein
MVIRTARCCDDAQANKSKVQAYHEKVRGFEEMYRENLRKTEAENDELSKEVRLPAVFEGDWAPTAKRPPPTNHHFAAFRSV